ncbi:MAG: 2-amino-4-hydroxy-6-hydroxymethyldihydropteridine diphosphokinase [Burkholderiaceae bacterium]|nr:2-amino-4-hydroxy-6-hydroxymethyldihydropteridine diphosphokinase [Burkholderiaceae bacterium]
MMRRAYIGLGANLGEPEETLHAALDALKSVERCELVGVSPFYRSAPIDCDGPDFVNAVASLDTELEPYGLLLHLQDIELMLGRKRRLGGEKRNVSRKADLDLLLVGSLILRSTPLTLPHPRLHQRAFVLRPLLDLDPELKAPALGRLDRFLDAVTDQRIERLDTPTG